MKDFRKAAQEKTNGSFIMTGREAIKTDMLIAAYPDGVTIVEADIIRTTDSDTGDEKEFAALAFAEDSSKYFNGGSSLTNIVKEWLKDYADTKTMSADLKASGGVKVKLSKESLKNGHTFVKVTVL